MLGLLGICAEYLFALFAIVLSSDPWIALVLIGTLTALQIASGCVSLKFASPASDAECVPMFCSIVMFSCFESRIGDLSLSGDERRSLIMGTCQGKQGLFVLLSIFCFVFLGVTFAAGTVYFDGVDGDDEWMKYLFVLGYFMFMYLLETRPITDDYNIVRLWYAVMAAFILWASFTVGLVYTTNREGEFPYVFYLILVVLILVYHFRVCFRQEEVKFASNVPERERKKLAELTRRA